MGSAYGGDVRLVEIFCAELQRQAIPEWNSLVSRLESKSGGPDEGERSAPAFLACVAQQEAHFSTAEFVWQGRESLRQASRKYPSPNAGEMRMLVVGTDFELPYVGSVSVEAASAKPAEGADPLGYAERSRRYDELWEDFLAGLRSRLNVPVGDGQVALNTR